MPRFGVSAVLEVTHLDGKPAKCDVSNLIFMCPTYHRMHDIRLIPTDLVIRMRDEIRLADWRELMKDGPEKAWAARRKKAAAQRAVATINARKAAGTDQ